MSLVEVQPESMQQQLLFQVPPSETILKSVDPQNPNCPYNQYVGNSKAVKRLARSAFAALSRHNHLCNDQYFALVGPASTGKTTLAKIHATVLGLPFVEVQPQSIKKIENLFDLIKNACDQYCGGKIKLKPCSNNKFVLPPIIIFIDEVHALSNRIVQSLLKATEHNDCKMITESGVEIDTRNVCWIIATTDRGLLFDAFDTRFEKIHLNLYSKQEIEIIVKKKYPQLDDECCRLIAHYNGNIPREALSFTREAMIVKQMENCSWKQAADIVAAERDIDKFGMSNQRVKILTALGKHPIPANQLARIVSCKEDELRKFIMVPLVCTTQNQPEPLVIVASGRGFVITESGLRELDKRNIKHNGAAAMPV